MASTKETKATEEIKAATTPESTTPRITITKEQLAQLRKKFSIFTGWVIWSTTGLFYSLIVAALGQYYLQEYKLASLHTISTIGYLASFMSAMTVDMAFFNIISTDPDHEKAFKFFDSICRHAFSAGFGMDVYSWATRLYGGGSDYGRNGIWLPILLGLETCLLLWALSERYKAKNQPLAYWKWKFE